MAMTAIRKAIRSASYYQNSTTRPFHQKKIRPRNQTYRLTTITERQRTLRTIHTSIRIKRPVQPGPYMDLEDIPQRRTMVTQTLIKARYQFRINPGHNNSRLHATMHPDTEGLLTPCASPKKYWTMNFHRVLNL